jgi:adhesin transport system outer membrane protein
MSSLAGVALAQEDQPLHPSLSISLRDALATGISTNPQYGEVAASRRATDEELKQGKAGYLPSVDVRADTGYEYTDSDLTDDSESMWRYLAGVTLTQMLFDGWETKYEVARQKARVRSSANRVRETAELVGLSIVEDYLEVLRQRQLLVIARQNVEAHTGILDQIRQGVEAGRSTDADNQQANARLAAARATEIRQSLRTAEAKYRQEVGDSAGQLTLPEVPYGSLTQDVDQEVEKALAYSPTLDIFESDIEVAYAESQGTKSTFYPQLDLELNANHGHDINGIEGDNTGASALVVMNWNLYRGGADMARSREFIHRHQQTKESRARAGRAVENDVRSTWASMVSAGERAREFAAQATANTEVVKAYQDQFSLDRRTLLDVLDAQNELFVSRSNTINAEFLEMFAVYRLLALKGALLPTMGVEYPRESAIASSEKWSTQEQMKAR